MIGMLNETSAISAAAIAFLIAAGSPGPATLAVANVAMKYGRLQALIMGAGLSVGLAIWGIVAGIGFSAILLHWAPALTILRISGGLFLFYLAWKSARSAQRPETDSRQEATAPSGMKIFQRGLLLNLLNPKAILAWIIVLAIGAPEGVATAEIVKIITLCAILGFGIYATYATAFSLTVIMAFYRRTRRYIEGILAVFFGWAGSKLIFAQQEAP